MSAPDTSPSLAPQSGASHTGPGSLSCRLHPDREAVVLCPSCRQPCCRECVTEHEDRYLCASCLRKLATPAATPARPSIWPLLTRPLHIGMGLLVAWTLFYSLGRALLRIPSEWHEGTVVESLVD